MGWTARARLAVTALAVAALLPSCARDRPFLWVNSISLPPEPDSREYRVGAGDVLSVRVWNQENMSASNVRVRDDGNISIPFLQDVEVAGMTPSELASRIAVKLKAYMVNPVVTVVVEARRPLRVSVLGEVTRAGSYELERGAGVLHALAAAGGLTPFAHSDRIFVLRQGYWADGSPDPARIRFRWEDLSGGIGKASAFRLRAGDVVVVE